MAATFIPQEHGNQIGEFVSMLGQLKQLEMQNQLIQLQAEESKAKTASQKLADQLTQHAIELADWNAKNRPEEYERKKQGEEADIAGKLAENRMKEASTNLANIQAGQVVPESQARIAASESQVRSNDLASAIAERQQRATESYQNASLGLQERALAQQGEHFREGFKFDREKLAAELAEREVSNAVLMMRAASDTPNPSGFLAAMAENPKLAKYAQAAQSHLNDPEDAKNAVEYELNVAKLLTRTGDPLDAALGMKIIKSQREDYFNQNKQSLQGMFGMTEQGPMSEGTTRIVEALDAYRARKAGMVDQGDEEAGGISSTQPSTQPTTQPKGSRQTNMRSLKNKPSTPDWVNRVKDHVAANPVLKESFGDAWAERPVKEEFVQASPNSMTSGYTSKTAVDSPKTEAFKRTPIDPATNFYLNDGVLKGRQKVTKWMDAATIKKFEQASKPDPLATGEENAAFATMLAEIARNYRKPTDAQQVAKMNQMAMWTMQDYVMNFGDLNAQQTKAWRQLLLDLGLASQAPTQPQQGVTNGNTSVY